MEIMLKVVLLCVCFGVCSGKSVENFEDENSVERARRNSPNCNNDSTTPSGGSTFSSNPSIPTSPPFTSTIRHAHSSITPPFTSTIRHAHSSITPRFTATTRHAHSSITPTTIPDLTSTLYTTTETKSTTPIVSSTSPAQTNCTVTAVSVTKYCEILCGSITCPPCEIQVCITRCITLLFQTIACF